MVRGELVEENDGDSDGDEEKGSHLLRHFVYFFVECCHRLLVTFLHVLFGRVRAFIHSFMCGCVAPAIVSFPARTRPYRAWLCPGLPPTELPRPGGGRGEVSVYVVMKLSVRSIVTVVRVGWWDQVCGMVIGVLACSLSAMAASLLSSSCFSLAISARAASRSLPSSLAFVEDLAASVSEAINFSRTDLRSEVCARGTL